MEGHAKNPNRPIPEEFKKVPELGEFLIFYWEVFWELSTERLVECGPIPGSKILQYSKDFDISYDELQPIIRALDGEYLKYIQEERDKKTSPKSKGASTIEDRIGKARSRQS